jgi:uncharacterized repeat protein (TIGR01451 family)
MRTPNGTAGHNGGVGRWLAAPGSFGGVLSILLVTVTVAASFPAFSLLHAIPTLQELDYSADRFAKIAPLRAEFIAEALGSTNLDRLLASLPPSSPAKDEGGIAPRSAFGAAPIPELPILPKADLRFSFRANSPTAAAGDVLEYIATVRNVGKADFNGNFTIDSHIPLGTTYVGRCEVPEIDEDGNVCYPAPIPGTTEGQNPDDPHGVTAIQDIQAKRTLRPHAEYVFKFRVRVNQGLPAGTEIKNHAHLTVLDKTQTSPVVVVTVR